MWIVRERVSGMAKRVTKSQRESAEAGMSLYEEISEYVRVQQMSGPKSREVGIGWLRACISHAVQLMESLCLDGKREIPDSARERVYQDVQDYLREKVQSEAR